MHIDPDPSQENEPREVTVSRRRLLQLLAASGAAVSLERLLPGKWTTPQATASSEAAGVPQIASLQIYWRAVNGGPYFNGTARFRYMDEAGGILSNSSLFAAGSMQGIIANGQPVEDIGGDFIPVNATHGTMRFPLITPLMINTEEKLGVRIADAFDHGRQSPDLVDTFPVYSDAFLNISGLHVVSEPAVNGTGCMVNAIFRYNGSQPGLLSPMTSLYAQLNTSGWISAGGTIANAGGTIQPVDNQRGAVRFPLPGTTAINSAVLLRLFVEDDDNMVDSNQLATVFSGCTAPEITELGYELCGPAVKDGAFWCKTDVKLAYYDAGAGITQDARVTIDYGGQPLIEDQLLADLGISPSNPVQGVLVVPVLIPPANGENGLVKDIEVMLVNESGVSSEAASTPYASTCEPDLPLMLQTTSVHIVQNGAQRNQDYQVWRSNFGYNDTAGVLSNTALLVAYVNSSGMLTTLYNGLPIGEAGGVVPNGYYAYLPENAPACALPINAAMGNGFFTFNYGGPVINASLSAAGAEQPTLNWFLTQPASRESGVQQVVLSDEPPDDGELNFLPIITRS